jgi:hypothetical protein
MVGPRNCAGLFFADGCEIHLASRRPFSFQGESFILGFPRIEILGLVL